MGIPPQPWQLKTFEDKYTPYFRPTHALPVPGFYATPTLTNTKAFPPERRPISLSKRLQSATNPHNADHPKSPPPSMGTATEVLDIWSELYRPKQPVKPIYSPIPPSVLSPSQKRRWIIAYAKLTEEEPNDKDPKNLRAYGELGKLKKLAELMERPSPPAGSEVWVRLGFGV